jgi:hypothetical protein
MATKIKKIPHPCPGDEESGVLRAGVSKKKCLAKRHFRFLD